MVGCSQFDGEARICHLLYGNERPLPFHYAPVGQRRLTGLPRLGLATVALHVPKSRFGPSRGAFRWSGLIARAATILAALRPPMAAERQSPNCG